MMATASSTSTKAIYELSINARVAWQAHSMSNAGSNGSNRLYPRHQLLATGEKSMPIVAILPSIILPRRLLNMLKLDYHLPANFSCRLPMSSASSAPASPAPGPATVRLALIRTGIEMLGMEDTRRLLFPSLCSMSVQIRPPERVAISPQVLRAYKMEEEAWGNQITESLMVREMAHADGPLTIYLRVPEPEATMWRELLLAIGYWGQTSSLAWCLHVEEQVPALRECIAPLRQ